MGDIGMLALVLCLVLFAEYLIFSEREWENQVEARLLDLEKELAETKRRLEKLEAER